MPQHMIPIMSPFLEERLRHLPSRSYSFPAGDHLFHRGDPIGVIHVVQDGMVHLVRHQADGSALVIQRAGPGQILAEASLYSPVYHCDAITAEASMTKAFPKADLLERMSRDPAFADTWARHLAEQLQRSRLQTEILSRKTVASRLDAWIDWTGEPDLPKGTWKTIANEIGVSPEAFYREMAKRRTVKKRMHGTPAKLARSTSVEPIAVGSRHRSTPQ